MDACILQGNISLGFTEGFRLATMGCKEREKLYTKNVDKLVEHEYRVVWYQMQSYGGEGSS